MRTGIVLLPPETLYLSLVMREVILMALSGTVKGEEHILKGDSSMLDTISEQHKTTSGKDALHLCKCSSTGTEGGV